MNTFGNMPNTTFGQTGLNEGTTFGNMGGGFNTFGSGMANNTTNSFGTANTGFGGGFGTTGGFGGGYGTGNTGFGMTGNTFGSNYGMSNNAFGASNGVKPSAIGAEYLNASASYLSAKELAEQRLSQYELNNAVRIPENVKLTQLSQGEFKSCFLNDSTQKISLYEQAIDSRSKITKKEEEKTQEVVVTQEENENELRSLYLQNEHGRVDITEICNVPLNFDLGDYIEIDPRACYLKKECPILNGKHAKVTLFNVFPQGRTKSEIEEYKEKVSTFTKQMGAILISYDENTGIWQFELSNLI